MNLNPNKYYFMQGKEMAAGVVRKGEFIPFPDRCLILREATKEEIKKK